jgi:hypothetical protein
MWPTGIPIRVRLWAPVLLFGDNDMIVRARLHGQDGPWAEKCVGIQPGRRTIDEWEPAVGALPHGTSDANFDIQILDHAAVATDQGGYVTAVDARTARPLWKGTGRLIKLRPSMAEVMTPIPESGSDRAGEYLSPRLVCDAAAAVRLSLIHSTTHLGDGTTDWALGMKCEVLHDGHVVGRGDVLYPMVEPNTIADHFSMRVEFDLNWSAVPPPAGELTGDWNLRFTGDPAVAINDLWRSTYWPGQFTVPVHEVWFSQQWRR